MVWGSLNHTYLHGVCHTSSDHNLILVSGCGYAIEVALTVFSVICAMTILANNISCIVFSCSSLWICMTIIINTFMCVCIYTVILCIHIVRRQDRDVGYFHMPPVSMTEFSPVTTPRLVVGKLNNPYGSERVATHKLNACAIIS